MTECAQGVPAAAIDPAAVREVAEGLSRTPRELSPRFFYDERGSRLFEEITRLPEYYLTRTERALLERWMPEWIRGLAPRALVELGAGSAEKTRIVLDAIAATVESAVYVPVDVSAEFLDQTAERIGAAYPSIDVVPLVADITDAFALPAELPRPTLHAFLGSTIGNFAPIPAIQLLRRVRERMGDGDRFLMGVDLRKDPAIVEAAYNDAQGVTAEFNRNMLRVVNTMTGADFAADAWEHRAFYDRDAHWIEMHLASTREQTVTLPGAGAFRFAAGETIRTEISAKHDRESVDAMFAAAGLRVERWETDADGLYALTLAAPPLTMPTLARADLLQDLRTHAFGLGRAPGPLRIGAEVELIPVSAATGAQVPVVSEDGPSTLPLLRRFGARHGWIEQPSAYGVPQWSLPDGGVISYEPGGQIELSAAAFPSATGLIRSLRATVLPLADTARDAGIDLLSVGVEPRNGLEDVDLQLPGKRYVRLTHFLRSIGTGGERMMRQTAAMQVSVDFGAEPLLAWRVLNAMAPYVIAIFASSPVYRGEPTGHRSYRARIWRELDGGRTGLFPAENPVDEYLDFSLAAPAILLGDGSCWRSFAQWNAEGCAGPDEWRAHLTTLFPEVRPKGFAEVRAADAVAPEWYAAPLVLLAGIVYHPPTLRAAADLLGAPEPALLHAAGRDGLSDARIAATARNLARLAMEGAAALPGFFAADDLDEAAACFARYTHRARSPADDALDALAASAESVCAAAD